MKSYLLLFISVFLFNIVQGQSSVYNYDWWNKLHGWEPGDPGWRNFMIISPGYFGPNALPVPPVKRGFLDAKTEFEITGSYHFHPGDPTQDLSGRIYLPFASNKIAVEIYGVIVEHFSYTEEIRNERISRIEDGKGFAIGDLYFSTLIQISKDRKFPNTLFRFATKTASGDKLEGARHTDSPGYFFDLSFSKEIGSQESYLLRPFGLFGFYTWQTNDELNLQNDAYMYALGLDFDKNNWLFSTSWSGYSGYKKHRDRPMQVNVEMRKDYEKKAFRIQYLHGLRDWEYKTIKISFIWKIKPIS
jgi:hypothetical protein